ncbi:MAG: hypothetical protein ABIH42_03005, partial [Planctomycetota bacterium]
MTKACSPYSDSEWDIVSAVEAGKSSITDLKEEQLPEKIKNMTIEERTEYINNKLKERKEAKERIEQLYKERENYLAENAAKQNNSLDAAMIGVIRDQLKNKNFEVDGK